MVEEDGEDATNGREGGGGGGCVIIYVVVRANPLSLQNPPTYVLVYSPFSAVRVPRSSRG